MNNECNQIDAIIKINKHKYLMIILPIALILISFAINHFFPQNRLLSNLQMVLTTVGLIYYFFVSLTHRITKQNCETERGEFYSPVNGKVIKVDNRLDFTEIFIKKGYFDKCDLRSCGGNEILTNNLGEIGNDFEWKVVSGKAFKLENTTDAKKIVAFSDQKLLLKIKINNSKIKCLTEVGEKVAAGESVWGELIEI